MSTRAASSDEGQGSWRRSHEAADERQVGTEAAGWDMPDRCFKAKSMKSLDGLAMSLLSLGVQIRLKLKAAGSGDLDHVSNVQELSRTLSID